MNEQSRDQEHEGHEEAVAEQRHQIEAEPAHAVAVAEHGIVDDGVVDQHQQGAEGARAVECCDASLRDGGLFVCARPLQRRYGLRNRHSVVPQIIRATNGILRSVATSAQLSDSVPANTIAALTTAGSE
jgi:hypothetical protein